jgi:protocatechuate 3,4-dioxygenase beta subunit
LLSVLRRRPPAIAAESDLRRCGIEELEGRQLRAGDLHLGAVYFEEASGDDSAGDRIEVTFAGGEPGTQLASMTINGDKLHDGGVTLGDIFFDTSAGGAGSFKAGALSLVSHDGFTISGVDVSDGSHLITFHFAGFDAGEKLVFEIDVDEQGSFSSTSVAEGGEFEGSRLTGAFVNPHFEDATLSAVFFDAYDDEFAQAAARAGTRLDLPPDSYIPPHTIDREDRTAGAVATFRQIARPITIAGRVFHDPNVSNSQDAGEPGLAGVSVTLLRWDGAGYVATGKTAATNGLGDYKFEGILPGRYRVVETQPSGYLSVGSRAGTVSGTTVGISTSPDVISEITLLGGQDSVNNNFAEVRPGSISGRVYADPEGDCVFGPNDTPLSGVEVQLLSATGTVLQTKLTDSSGQYKFDGLLPGTYGVREVQPAGYYQGGQKIGSAGGVISAPDVTSQILLTAATGAVDYDFCELLPAQLGGRVFADPEGDGQLGTNDLRLDGVTIELLNAQGGIVQTTQTNAQGEYHFVNLAPGVYSVREIQPAGYYHGGQRAGSHGGNAAVADVISQIALGSAANAVRYDFWELLPGSISGTVHADPEGDCIIGPQDIPLAGVAIELLDAGGNVLQTTVTNNRGEYRFENLAPGTYSVRQIQPAGYYQGGEHVGSAGGVIVRDNLIGQIEIRSATDAVRYDFCELLPATLRGRVYADPEADCVFGTRDTPLAGVRIELLNEHDIVVATTLTGADGRYEFANLAPGEYSIREIQPAGYFQGGTLVGDAGGVVRAPDLIAEVLLTSGKIGNNYDFCENLPSSISGRVYADPEGDCVFGPLDRPLAGVRVDLLDAHGQQVGTTLTDAAGRYRFDNLAPGAYAVREHQPSGYFQGGSVVGSAGGLAQGDIISQIVLVSATDAVNYDFCELIPASISGSVHADTDGDCIAEPGDIPLAGVTVQLLNGHGVVVGTTLTDAAGRYRFDGLAPGAYSVREIQPAGFFDGGEHVGTAGGVIATNDLISQIVLRSGTTAADYDFCEIPAGTISGYVFQDGPTILVPEGETADPASVRDGRRDAGDSPIAGVTLILGDATGQAFRDAAGNPRTTVTDANGFYRFTGLPPGTYTVRQIQPANYIDFIDTPGTSGGVAINRNGQISPQILQTLTVAHDFDAIVQIPLPAGVTSVENNFSEVLVAQTRPAPPIILSPLTNPERPRIYNPGVAPRTAPERIFAVPLAPVIQPEFIGGHNAGISTWHLSVVNGGVPRGIRSGETLVEASATMFNVSTWTGAKLDEAQWMLVGQVDEPATMPLFGAAHATPIAGDFNGDGRTEIGVFLDGEWFIDINGNGLWDEDDLWASLGTEGDLPVVGDWDGDGKDDIGVFGPAWAGDPRAIRREPGLPQALNKPKALAKNVPPSREDAPLGKRMVKVSVQGALRADLIDHVFNFGVSGDHAVAGDWAGNGVDCIGVFRNGVWHLDVNGDGLFDSAVDRRADFGRRGDAPIVGDWNGDGLDELGVYRDGEWILDSNRNYRIDAEDERVRAGRAGDKAVAGDWNGDGRDQVGVMHLGRIEREVRR